jgi:hypothetical protein
MDVELLREALMCYLGTGHGGNRFDEIDVALDALDQWAKDAKLGAVAREHRTVIINCLVDRDTVRAHKAEEALAAAGLMEE